MSRLFFVCICLFALSACQPEAQQTQQDTAVQQPKTELKRTPDLALEESKKYLERMNQFIAEEDFESALVEAEQAAYQLETVISIDPNYTSALAGDLGRAHYYQSNYSQALTYYAQASEADPSNAAFHRMQGMTQFNLGSIEDAQASVARSISVADNSKNREAIISEMMRIGNTSFDYGTAYIEDGYPSKGTDYQRYGLAMYRMAHELGGAKEEELVKQIVSWGKFLKDSEVVTTYEPLLR